MRERVSEPLLLSLLVLLAILAFAQSYASWLHPIIDTGRDLYIPEQLRAGATLYRDIRYQYPPLAPYLLAAITAVAGSSLAAYTVIGVLQSLATAAALYLLVRRAAGVTAAAVAAFCFVAMNFTGASTWGANYLFPYSYAATFGMLFFLLFASSAMANRETWAVAFALAAAWCKIEYAVAAALSLLALALFRRISWKSAGIFAALLGATIAGASFWFRGTGWIGENVFAASLTRGESAKRFFASVAGTADLAMTAGQAAIGIAVFVAILLLSRAHPWAGVAAAVVAALLVPPNAPFRACALGQWAALLWAIARDRGSALLPLSVFSIAATLRIPMNVAPSWYGFVLVVPLYALIAYVLFAYLPERGAGGRKAAAAWIAFFVILGGRHLLAQRAHYERFVHPVASARGVFYDANAARARSLDRFLGEVRARSFVVIPEGITLNYLARATTPLSFHTFTPVEVAAPEVEAKILAEIVRTRPERIVFVTRDVREFGYAGFGIDYGLQLTGHIRSKYRLEWRHEEPGFQIYVLIRA